MARAPGDEFDRACDVYVRGFAALAEAAERAAAAGAPVRLDTARVLAILRATPDRGRAAVRAWALANLPPPASVAEALEYGRVLVGNRWIWDDPDDYSDYRDEEARLLLAPMGAADFARLLVASGRFDARLGATDSTYGFEGRELLARAVAMKCVELVDAALYGRFPRPERAALLHLLMDISQLKNRVPYGGLYVLWQLEAARHLGVIGTAGFVRVRPRALLKEMFDRAGGVLRLLPASTPPPLDTSAPLAAAGAREFARRWRRAAAGNAAAAAALLAATAAGASRLSRGARAIAYAGLPVRDPVDRVAIETDDI